MTTWEQMKYGPLGDAVERSREWSEGDPIGIYAAALSMWSAALAGRVVQPNGRPVAVWTAMVGKSKVGRKGFALATAQAAIGPSIAGFLNSRTRKGITSGPALVTTLFEVVQETLAAESGVDGRILVVEDEWASTLRRANRDATYHDQLIHAWDGAELVNTIKGKKGKREEERVDDPLLGFHGHIQPARWHRLIKPDDALGGVYNRILPVLVERAKRLSSKIKDPLSNITESPALTRAYKWARSEPRVIELSEAAANRHDNYRAELEDQLEEMPEELSCLIERADEHLLRIACVITAAERKTTITVKAWEAARAFVDYSMSSVRRLASEAETRGRRAPKPLPELIRDVLQRYGGEVKSGDMLRAIGSTRANSAGIRAAVEDMEDVEIEKVKSGGRGAPSIVYRLVDPAEKRDQGPEEQTTAEPAAAVPERAPEVAALTRPTRLRVVDHAAPASATVPRKPAAAKQPTRTTARPATRKRTTSTPAPAAPAANSNPFMALL
ncbi:DUF3987 domain-containing protein [Kitasatospora cineracea]|uniref:DUF3987 domain-containing protein n=1 Tax=Kitasatospora cineracea TaxID=88074 RepID=UPI003812ACF6